MFESKMADIEERDQKPHYDEIASMKKQAEDFLESRYFYAAFDQYENILKINPNDKDAHIGALLAKNKVLNETQLIAHYQDLFSLEESEIKLACEKEESHVEEMAERLCLPGYLEKEEIRKLYDFVVSYKSSEFCRKRQRDDILKEIEKDEHLSWLKRNGFKEIAEIISAYDRRLEEAKNADKENIQRIRNEYQRFLYKTYADAKQLSSKAKERKEDDYRQLISRYEESTDLDELKELFYRFEKFADYKEGKKYISLCDEKIEKLKNAADKEMFKRVIENSLVGARASLVTEKFSEAYETYTRIISMDPENEEAHLGILMARTQTCDAQQLFDYYKNLYSEEEYDTLEACEEDTSHIEEMAEKYYLPDYLDKETIYEKYLYDRTYRSILNCRIRQEKQFNEEIASDPVFAWLRRNADEKVRRQIEDVVNTYSRRTQEAREEDKKKSEQIKNDYQRFLFKTYSSIKTAYKKANEKKEETYKKLIRSIDLAQSEKELKELIASFEELGPYKESGTYIASCRKKIEELKKKEEDETIAQDIETTLIAARAYLSTGNKEMADRNFEKVLSMDPDNARAYLGILMIETDTKDLDSLASYYFSQYNEDEVKVEEACKEDRNHIDKKVEECYIPGYLEKETIEKYYTFDRFFESLTASRIAQKEQFDEEVKMNPLLNKIAASDDPEVLRFFEKVRSGFDLRIVEARKADERQIESIRHIYEVYLEESDKTLQMVYEEKLREKEADQEAVYRKNEEEFSRELSEEELEELSKRFDPDYKDGKQYIEDCKQRILSLRKAREKEKLDALSKEGTELLECRLFEDAKQKFASYIDIDPENEDVILKYLMADKKVIDQSELFEYYKQLYLYDIPETKEAVEEDGKHIEEICDKCYVADKLEKYEIRRRYEFERTYESLSNCRNVQLRQIEDEVRLDPYLSWLKENGSDKSKTLIQDLVDTYELRAIDAQENDRKKADSIRREYRSFIRNTDKEVRSIYNELIKESNRKLKELRKEQKENERRLKEEAERQRLEAEKQRNEAEKQRKEAFQKEKEKETEAQSVKIVEKEKLTAAEKEKKLAAEKEKKKHTEIEQLEKEAAKKLEKERRRQERQKAFADLKAKYFTKKEAVPGQEKKPVQFGPNLALIAAAASVLVLGFLVYTYVIVPSNKYNNALSLSQSGQYDEAIAIFEELGDYKDSAYQVKSATYAKADALYQEGNTVEAAKIFNNLRFDDSEDRVKAIKKELISNAQIGDSIYFGDYEQDGITDNGKEMIEWIVLDEAEGSILVISKGALDARTFNDSSGEVYWENSSLRFWLNGRFPDNAFSKEDPSNVLSTTLENTRYPLQEDEEEDVEELILETYETRDRLFVLSYDEIMQYFPNEDERSCIASEFAIENGARASADGSSSWWLRTPGNDRTETAYIWDQYGSIASSPQMIVQAVRPAMWLKAE